MELFYFRYGLSPELTGEARRLGIPEGQPFILDEQGTSLDSFCSRVGVNRSELNKGLDSRPAPEEAITLSCVPDVNDYLLFRTATSRSQNTWKADAEQLSIFLRWLTSQGKAWSQVTLTDLQAFYRTRRLQPSPHTGRPISIKTWNSCVGALSRFYRWAVEQGRIEQSPFTYRTILIPQVGTVEKNTLTDSVPEEPIRYITLDEYKIFKQALGRSRNGGRDKAFADTLLSTGLRLSEGNSLTVGQIPDPDAPRYKGVKSIPFLVTGKGRKTRRIRFPKSALREIEIYKGEDRANSIARWKSRVPRYRSLGRGGPAELWLTERGTPMSNPRWEEIFAEASRACGIHCTPHMLRHTYAIYTLSSLIKKTICSINEFRAKGAEQYGKIIHNPLRRLADLLGHSHIATTFVYLDFVEQCESVVDDAIDEWSKEIP